MSKKFKAMILTIHSSTAGTWLFGHRRWLDPCVSEDLEHLRRVCMLLSRHPSTQWFTDVESISYVFEAKALLKAACGRASSNSRSAILTS